jgi:glycerol uptake facilitator protein
MPSPAIPTLAQRLTAEFVGTFLLVFFGCGAVHAAVLLGAQQGLWQVAIVWGVAIMLAIYSCGAISGAHINPAMTVAFALVRDFPRAWIAPYAAAQSCGAFAAAACLFFLFQQPLADKEQAKGVRRGEPGSIVTAMCYGEYFPSPGGLAGGEEKLTTADLERQASAAQPLSAFVAEFLGTMILALVVFAVTDGDNPGRPAAGLEPVFIGLTVAALISVIAPLTQACFNPARDFGPRLFSALAGWGATPFTANPAQGWLTVYIVAPLLGAVAGGAFYQRLLRPALVGKQNGK